MAQHIKVLLSFMKFAPKALALFARKIYAGMNENPEFPKPAVPMKALAAQIETFSSWIVEAMDGSRKAIAEPDRQGGKLPGMLRELAAYVEYVFTTAHVPANPTHSHLPPTHR